ncbi:MAG: sugar transferase [Verrucomicrobia bacterium]|nr:sugar transferase [Verrucomicrobiota bacterium]
MNSSHSSINPLPRWKRAIDLGCCAIAFPAFVVLTLFVTVLMRMTSPGTIFFRQERVGLGGRRFKIFKFRTMHVGADTKGHQKHFAELIQSNSPMQKLDAKRDCRLIPGGWLLRSTGLDELPQIVNIWRGEMSVVGPRPCIPYEYEQYTVAQRERCDSLPGLTGLWQVSGKNRTTFEEMIRLDRKYKETKSFWLDLRIILMTVPALCIQLADVSKARRNVAPANRVPPLDPAPSETAGKKDGAVVARSLRTSS